MSKLFEPLRIRGTVIRNRLGLSPMSMYEARNGVNGPFSPIHYGARSAGGAGLVLTGTVAVSPEGRITPADPGIWSDDHIASHSEIARAIKLGGAVPGIQIGHAGRKASTTVPWQGGSPRSDGRSLTAAEGAWESLGPTTDAYGGDKTHRPRTAEPKDLRRLITAFSDAARRADAAGFEVLELHAAHGYLLHSFYSPISNTRSDEWGGTGAGRMRLTLEVIRAVRESWPHEKPLALRFAMDDFVDDGWSTEDGLALARMAIDEGVDMLDPMSFGGIEARGAADWSRNFTAEHAQMLKAAFPRALVMGSAQTAPGFDTDPRSIESLISEDAMDIVLLGRQLLADPHYPAKAAAALGHQDFQFPANYEHWLSGRADQLLPVETHTGGPA